MIFLNLPPGVLLTLSHIPFTLRASDGEPIFCDARFIDGADGLPVVIFVHGFKGFKEWGSIPFICESMARRGFYAISFNFSHNGVEGNSGEFTRLDRFERNTFSREVRELQEVVDAVAAGAVPHPEQILSGEIALIGHSRGGGIAILEAGNDPRVRGVAAWGSVADFNRYSPAQRNRWRAGGVFETKNMRTGQIMRLGLTLLDDIEANSDALDIGAAAASLHRPLLILHGEQDLAVRIGDGERLASLGDPAFTEFVPIPRANHTFGAAHPFAGSNPVLDEAIERTAEFFRSRAFGAAT
ncbi:MAG: alpha/beta hydrolase fold protein [Chlorobi bacterium]|nr:alpha/beta hydrolase fold protein [Chlorobiota bacterium]